MKKKSILFLIILLSTYSFSQEYIDNNDIHWKKIELEKMNVNIEYPNEQIQHYEDIIRTKEYGKVLRKTVQWKSLDTNKAINNFYTLNYYQYPKYKFKPTESDNFYTNQINLILNDLDGELIYKKQITHNKNQGIEFSYSLSQYNIIITERIFLIKNSSYSLSVFTTKKNENNSSIFKFFNSFQLN